MTIEQTSTLISVVSTIKHLTEAVMSLEQAEFHFRHANHEMIDTNGEEDEMAVYLIFERAKAKMMNTKTGLLQTIRNLSLSYSLRTEKDIEEAGS